MVCDGVIVFFQAEDGIRDLVRSRGLGDVYKRQGFNCRGINGIMPALFRGNPVFYVIMGLIVVIQILLSLIHI